MEARRAWHVAAIAAFAVAAVTHTRHWFTDDLMPPGDFAGYAAQVQYVRDSLLEHGRVPIWCVECYGGTTNFTANLKEYLVFPLAVAFEPVMATKIAFVVLRWIAALGLYLFVARVFAAPAVGIAAGYAYSYCAMANSQMHHLDVAVATAILPFLWLSAVELLRGGGASWAIALGVAMACQLSNNWVHAATAPLAVIALALVRPWRGGDDRPPWRDRALARRWAVRGLAAFAVFCAFAASSVTWLASDARHHGLMPSYTIELQRLYYVERSPFLFANRDGVLNGWLETHAPIYRTLVSGDRGTRYLGGVLVAVIAVGAWLSRRDPALRRWAALAGLAWLLQYWLALGPRTLLWEFSESVHFWPETQTRLTWILRAAAAGCALAGAALVVWRRGGGRGAAIATRAPLLFTAALLLFFPTASLWSACARVLPMFALQRSPGHFFDTAPFSLALLFAVCLTAIARRFARPLLAHGLAIAVAAALVLDYWPSTRSFAAGEPLRQLRQSAALVADLPSDGGMLRIGLGPGYSPISSWLLAHSRAGHAWGWIFWQAGRYWRDGYAFAAFGDVEPGNTPAWSDRYAPLLDAARVRYVLVQTGAMRPGYAWRPVRSNDRFVLWEQSDVAPPAQGYRAWVLWTGDDPNWAAQAAAEALRLNAPLVALPDDRAAAEAVRAHAMTVVAGEPRVPLLAAPAPEPVAAELRRREPERIEVELDAGASPALAFVSEGYHPWWRAEVDGRPAPVLRASIAHMAVPVGPGRHAVELRLVRPFFVAAADAITAAAWVALALGCGWVLLRRRAER